MPTTDELITTALHERAARVTQDRLRYPYLRPGRPASAAGGRSRPRPWTGYVAVAAGIVVILLVIGGGYALRTAARHPGQVAGGATQRGLLGRQWRLTTVANAIVEPTDVRATYRAELTFHRDGTFVGRDGIHALTGTFRTRRDHANLLLISHTTATGNGTSTAPGPAQLAMSSLYATNSVDVNVATSTYSVSGTELTIQSPSWVLVFTAR